MAKSPLEEHNESLRKSAKELDASTSDLRKPFKDLVKNLGETNSELADIASGALSQSAGTWKGMITESRIAKLTNATVESQMYKDANARLKSAQDQTVALKEKMYQDEKDAEVQLQAKFKSSSFLTQLENEKIELQSKIAGANKDELRKINEGIAERDKRIGEEKKVFSDGIDSQLESKKAAAEKEIKLIEETGHEDRLAVSKANTEYAEKIEEASKTPAYDKFGGAIKELTGGMVDIGSVLDPIAKKWGAIKDLGSMISSGFDKTRKVVNKGADTYKNLFNSQEEQDEDRKESTADFVSKTLEGSEDMAEAGDNIRLFNLGIMSGLAMIAIGILAPILAIVATIAAIAIAVKNASFSGMGQAVKTFVEKFGTVMKTSAKSISTGWDKVKGGFSKLKFWDKGKDVVDDVAKGLPKGTKIPDNVKLKADGTPDMRTKEAKALVDDVAKGTKGVADDVLQATSKGGWWTKIKSVGSTLVKKLPLIGAAVETGMDGFENYQDIESLRKGREEGTLMKKEVDAETGIETEREYTDEEMDELEKAFLANQAGSVGRGAGSFAAGVGGAVLGAKLGASVGLIGGPVGVAIGGFLGTLIGGVAGAVMGGKAGDVLATELAEEVIGGDNSEQLVKDALGNIKVTAESDEQPSGDQIAVATEEVSEGEKRAVAVTTVANTQNNLSNSNTSNVSAGGQHQKDTSNASRLSAQSE